MKCAPCDTLILLDCCYVESAGLDKATQRTELLAAWGTEAGFGEVNNYSLTRNQIDRLQSLGPKPFTVMQLYERIQLAEKRPRNTPQYVPLNGRCRPIIRIAPMQPLVLEFTATSSATVSSRGSSSSSVHPSLTRTYMSATASTTHVAARARALLAISSEGKQLPKLLSHRSNKSNARCPHAFVKSSPTFKSRERSRAIRL